MLKGDNDGAFEFGLQDLRANPGNYFSNINIANLHGLLGRHEEAQTSWKKAQELSPGLTFEMFSNGYRSVMADPALAERFSAGLTLAGIR